MTEGPQLDPLPAEALEMLRQVSTSTVATQLYKRGFLQPQLLGVRALSRVSDGFVAERGDTRAASGGDMLMTRAWKRGAAAFMTDGGLREGHVLPELPLATYAGTVTITTRAAWHHVADLQVPIGCAGVGGYPGDVLMGDRDEVIVIPRSPVAEQAEPSLEQERIEAFVTKKIHAGEPLRGNYPPGEDTIAEYKASLAEGAGDG